MRQISQRLTTSRQEVKRSRLSLSAIDSDRLLALDKAGDPPLQTHYAYAIRDPRVFTRYLTQQRVRFR